MITIFIALPLSLIFFSLSAIHIYWASGGKWAGGAVIPTINDEVKAVMPGPIPTLMVAAVLSGFGLLVLVKSDWLNIEIPSLLLTYGIWAIAVIFLIRAIGDFRYVGFFKNYKQTRFGINDTRYYSPLCLLISLLAILLEIFSKV